MCSIIPSEFCISFIINRGRYLLLLFILLALIVTEKCTEFQSGFHFYHIGMEL